MELEQITEKIIGCALRVHTELGPGLLEGVYETCLKHELVKAGMRVRAQVPLPINYDGIRFDSVYKLDLLVEEQVVVELKAVEQALDVHKAQVISYLKLGGYPVGLLINFNVVHLRDGIRRLVNRPKASVASVSSL